MIASLTQGVEEEYLLVEETKADLS